jgi:hypothetical protein
VGLCEYAVDRLQSSVPWAAVCVQVSLTGSKSSQKAVLPEVVGVGVGVFVEVDVLVGVGVLVGEAVGVGVGVGPTSVLVGVGMGVGVLVGCYGLDCLEVQGRNKWRGADIENGLRP